MKTGKLTQVPKRDLAASKVNTFCKDKQPDSLTPINKKARANRMTPTKETMVDKWEETPRSPPIPHRKMPLPEDSDDEPLVLSVKPGVKELEVEYAGTKKTEITNQTGSDEEYSSSDDEEGLNMQMQAVQKAVPREMVQYLSSLPEDDQQQISHMMLNAELQGTIDASASTAEL